jgi:hypothetical protein
LNDVSSQIGLRDPSVMCAVTVDVVAVAPSPDSLPIDRPVTSARRIVAWPSPRGTDSPSVSILTFSRPALAIKSSASATAASPIGGPGNDQTMTATRTHPTAQDASVSAQLLQMVLPLVMTPGAFCTVAFDWRHDASLE